MRLRCENERAHSRAPLGEFFWQTGGRERAVKSQCVIGVEKFTAVMAAV